MSGSILLKIKADDQLGDYALLILLNSINDMIVNLAAPILNGNDSASIGLDFDDGPIADLAFIPTIADLKCNWCAAVKTRTSGSQYDGLGVRVRIVRLHSSKRDGACGDEILSNLYDACEKQCCRSGKES